MRDKLDLSGCNVRVRGVLRRLDIDTVEKLLALDEAELSVLKNCGAKTIAKILQLQIDYGKEPLVAEEQRQIIDGIKKSGLVYVNKLIVVAMAANALTEETEEIGHYYYSVSTQRFNTLRRTLKALRKHGIQ